MRRSSSALVPTSSTPSARMEGHRSIILFLGEAVAARVVALGLLPVLLGLAITVQPVPEAGDRVFASLLCLLPGLFVIGAFGVFWALAVQTR